MDSEAVKLWREQFKLNLSTSWKRDVEKTVTDLDLWKEILDGWFYVKHGKKVTKHPGIKGLLTEYERLESSNTRDNQASAVSTRGRKRLPPGSNSDMPKVQIEPPSIYFRVS